MIRGLVAIAIALTWVGLCRTLRTVMGEVAYLAMWAAVTAGVTGWSFYDDDMFGAAIGLGITWFALWNLRSAIRTPLDR